MSMIPFHCQFDGIDDPAEWREVMAYTAEFAAIGYAEKMDCASGGELLRDGRGVERVRVKNQSGAVLEFEITAEFSKDFYARQVTRD